MKNDTTIKNILFPTDFTDLAENAMIAAIAECKRHNAILNVLHVVENRLMMVPPQTTVATFYVVPELGKRNSDMLDALVLKIAKKHSIIVKSHLEFGNPADAIRDKAIELGCELVIMGTDGASGFRELFIGSTAYTLIRNTTIPVLTIPGKKKVKDFKKILFPIRAANGILEKYDFIEPIIDKNESELMIPGLSLSSEIFNMNDRENELLKLGQSLSSQDTTFRSEFHVCKNYAKKVLEVAKKQKVDLIVINATLDYTWDQFFTGPYAQ